jgi:hypothetical protein
VAAAITASAAARLSHHNLAAVVSDGSGRSDQVSKSVAKFRKSEGS